MTNCMDGFSWLVIIPILVLFFTIVALVKLFPSNHTKKECYQSPLLCSADSTNGSKQLDEVIRNGDEKIAQKCQEHIRKNGNFEDYIR